MSFNNYFQLGVVMVTVLAMGLPISSYGADSGLEVFGMFQNKPRQQEALLKAYFESQRPENIERRKRREQERRDRAAKIQEDKEYWNTHVRQEDIIYPNAPLAPRSERLHPTSRAAFEKEIQENPAPNGVEVFRVPSKPIDLIQFVFEDPVIIAAINKNGIEVPEELAQGLIDPLNTFVRHSLVLGGDVELGTGKTVRFEDYQSFKNSVLDKLTIDSYFYFATALGRHPITEWLTEILIETNPSKEAVYKSIRQYLYTYVDRPIEQMLRKLHPYYNVVIYSSYKPYAFDRALTKKRTAGTSDNFKKVLKDNRIKFKDFKAMVNDTKALIESPLDRLQFAVFVWSYFSTDTGEFMLAEGDLRDTAMELLRNGNSDFGKRSCGDIIDSDPALD